MATTLVRRHAAISLPASAAITGGQLVAGVVASGVDKGQPAGAGSLVVLGVARFDAAPTDTSAGTSINLAPIPTDVTADNNGEFVVTYAADATIGQKLIAAAAGAVTPAGATPDARTIVGYCTQSTTAGQQGRAYIGH